MIEIWKDIDGFENYQVSNPQHKLSTENIIEIRKLKDKLTGREIGEIYGITQSHVSAIINNKQWKHI
jgi:DNA-directed RNA polymerase specialized sigma subunit